MPTLQTFLHDPDAKLDYSVDWTLWLPTGDAVDTSTWAVSPEGPTLTSSTIDIDGKITTIWFEGGTAGSKYVLTNHIITTEGREDDRSITLKLAER